MRVKIIGIPGCGKSTIIENLQKQGANIRVIKDKLYKERALKALKSNIMQNAVIFQDEVLTNWVNSELFEGDDKETNISIEHTPIEMIEFFTTAYKLAGFISEYGFNYLRDKFYSSGIASRRNADTAYIYIECPPEDAIRNMKIRGRKDEGSIDPFILHTINHLLLLHHDYNRNENKMLLRYRENDLHTDTLLRFLGELSWETFRKDAINIIEKGNVKK